MNIKAINITFSFLLGICFTVRAELIVPSEEEIRQLAKATVAEQIDNIAGTKVVIEPQMLGARMTPPRCEYPLQASMASDREINRNNTVRISCTTPDLDYPWQMFVAVRFEILRPVVVADAHIDPGQLLGTDNLRLEWIDEIQLRGSQFENVHDLLGTRAKRRIAKDSAIFAANVCYVCRGDKVKILARAPGFMVKTYGEALQDGVVGDQIRIKNTHSNKQLDAIITAIAAVEVKM
ncbi:MAG: flagellar basal body P-ring formation protein FlgA [Shewanella sp.]|nr:flagellar basal body P-ring formation protein FlgA [Shewanella sp.]MCF1429785.1 flagellar basal body P-ring formation protein FlgA [Shewanella sp.]MCF1438683.1 flagellar basal body P-ring formation protein FlgA [Shewanella sp.]MCF1457022.1 flagellar basal body P-ring formation protein FlgA [Shewanella sp.]